MQKGDIIKVRTIIRNFFKKHQREFPWRETTDPYAILVSELMLQQTQTDRVVPKYTVFIKKYPSAELLARASLSEILSLWQGLGYNRRAKFLHSAAKEVMRRGYFPKSIVELETLPGVGRYTARAVAAFAYNTPSFFIETNIRTVLIHHFFSDKEAVSDKELIPYLEKLIGTKEPRFWYSALMDYGSFLKKEKKNVSHRKSSVYKKQSPLKGSVREVRGEIIILLTQKKGSVPISFLQKKYTSDPRFEKALIGLQKDGIVVQTKTSVRIVS